MTASPKLFLILDNIRSAHNVGSILRTAESAGATKVFLTGITPTPENPKVLKTSLNAHKSVPWEHHCSTLPLILYLHDQRIPCFACEAIPKATNVFDYPFSHQAAFILGNENTGISPDVIKVANAVIKIPQFGHKESLNVATAAGIVAYEFVRRHHI